VKEVIISTTPLVNVTTQVLLAQKPMPPANSMVTLFFGIPSALSSIISSIPKNATVLLRQVCRRTYCVACDEGTATCIRYITVGLSKLDGNITANTTSIRRDVMYTFVESYCTPQISGLSAEYVSNNVVVISSVAVVSSMRVACASNSSMFVDIPVDP
jgi:hypothetical protein